MNLKLDNARGQCYDGAAVISGEKAGVATQIKAINSKCLYTHCYGHALNLSVKDACTKIQCLKDTFDTAKEICKLVKKSPQRETYLRKLRIQSGNKEKSVHAFCPTRWTVRGATLASIIDNHNELMSLWEHSLSITNDTEMKDRIIGAQTNMKKFSFLFGSLLGEKVLMQTDNLSRSLQSPELSAIEAHQLAEAVIGSLQQERNEATFNSFWDTVCNKRDELDINREKLPRKRKHPRHLTDFFGYVQAPEQEFCLSKDMYRAKYFECYDFVIKAISDRFDQPDYTVYSAMENIILMTFRGEDVNDEMRRPLINNKSFETLYEDDIDIPMLEVQLKLLPNLLNIDDNLNIPFILGKIRLLSIAQRRIICEVVKLLKLILLAPATNAESERIFSALKRVKTYLRSTMGEKRLGGLMVLHVHKEETDLINIIDAANNFTTKKSSRGLTFGKFSQHDINKSSKTRSVGVQTEH